MTVIIELAQRLCASTSTFTQEAHSILAYHESSPSRVVLLDKSRVRLSSLSIDQEGLFDQALQCIQFGIHQAATVMAWAAFMDFLDTKLASDGLIKLAAAKPGWARHSTIEELRENTNEHDRITAARDLKLLNKAEMKALHGMLSKRNESAHPTPYKPELNESLGYVAELLNRIASMKSRTL
ncbi:MAG: hypothetical protein JWO59_3126 [Chloroflexi bacterium]|nr:hypothetical protein [Chloroflexota bacterium]